MKIKTVSLNNSAEMRSNKMSLELQLCQKLTTVKGLSGAAKAMLAGASCEVNLPWLCAGMRLGHQKRQATREVLQARPAWPE